MEEWVRTLFKKGTPQCGLAYGVIAFVFGLLLVLIGFWKTLLIAVLCALAAFWGGVQNHEQALKNGMNKVIPHEPTALKKERKDKQHAQEEKPSDTKEE